MGGRGIASKYDNGCPLVKKKSDPFLRILPDGSVVEIPIRTPRIVSEIHIIIFGEYCAKLLQYR